MKDNAMNRILRPLLSSILLLPLAACGLLEPLPPGAPRPQMINQATCSGCGGSGMGADFLRRQGLPQAPGYSEGECPRCGGTGRVY
jgi:hypothetical protein